MLIWHCGLIETGFIITLCWKKILQFNKLILFLRKDMFVIFPVLSPKNGMIRCDFTNKGTHVFIMFLSRWKLSKPIDHNENLVNISNIIYLSLENWDFLDIAYFC